FGIFVELQDIYVEGLVHITSLPKDYYQFEPVSHRLMGERGGLVFQLGDAITVDVAGVNLDERKIDFTVANLENIENKRRKTKSRGKKQGAEKSAKDSEEAKPKKKRSRKKRAKKKTDK
ncbi:MAG: S1 RNA-binding domain-containing protein, partial [Gammaproteobacteria bacterium]|nr:S1 RNA-binding domain-containing protein [Gammaproteobacteria bacterium]